MPFESLEVKLNFSKAYLLIYVLLSVSFLLTLAITVPWHIAIPFSLLLIFYSVQVLHNSIRPQYIRFKLLTASLWQVTLRNQQQQIILKTNVFRSAWLLSLQGSNLSTGQTFTLLLPRDAVKRSQYDQLLYLLF